MIGKSKMNFIINDYYLKMALYFINAYELYSPHFKYEIWPDCISYHKELYLIIYLSFFFFITFKL